MVAEACCNRDRTQAVFPDPVIPAIMEVKGCSKQNRWHFCANIATVSKGVRPALRCLDITCLCILSFLLKNFSQTEQNQLMSTPQEQNVDWERGRMLRIYIGFQAIKFYCFPPPRPLTPHFNCFPSTTTTTATTFLLFFLHPHHHHHRHISIVFFPPPPLPPHDISIVFPLPPPPPPHFYCFPPPPQSPHFHCFPSTRFYKRLLTAILSSFWSNVLCSEQQSCSSLTVSWLPCLSAPFLLKTATPQQLQAIVQVLHNMLMGHIPISEENKLILLPYKDALLDLASPNVRFKTKKRVLVHEGTGFTEDVLAPVVSSLGFLML